MVEATAFGYDGITNVITNYYEYQDHQKIHMDILTINPVSDTFLKTLLMHGSKNYVLPYRNTTPLKYICQLSGILRRGNYSVIHAHGCSATMAVEMLAARLAGVKARIAHSHNTTCDHVKSDRLLRPFFKKWCNVGFACGKEAGEWLFPNKKFTIISNGIDLDKFQFNGEARISLRKKYNLEDCLVIGHVGRFSMQKNHKRLLGIFEEFAREHEDARLVLVGDGELREEIEAKSKEEGLRVLFVGLSDYVAGWLQAMDVFVFPSLFEGLPLSLIEAQAAGLPCIISDTVSEMAKVTDHVQFVSLNAGNGEWCQRIVEAAGTYSREKQKDFIKAQIRDAHFDIRQNCAELSNVYEKVVKEANNGQAYKI